MRILWIILGGGLVVFGAILAIYIAWTTVMYFTEHHYEELREKLRKEKEVKK